ncbi:testis-expressed protein 47 isoform X2 [Chelonia mydas]|uniref:testis-expressed protein 47 isoform X2 n=1 Tax=Chelonia mydas TaxID=8469 RepID=UPI001CAA3E79|nr:testis-expressed protein 47 isoform X2 [Chelonia mydas]
MSGAHPSRTKGSVRAESLVPALIPRSNLLGALEEKRRLQLKKFLLHRLFFVAKLSERADRREVTGYHERLFQNILKYHLGEPVSGLLLLYPSSILHILESSSGTLYHILQALASLQKQGSRLFLQWYVTMVILPVTYLEDVTQSESTEEVVTECLTLLLKLGTYLSKTFKVSSKGLGDNLHTLVPELLIPAETINYLCKAKEFMSPEAFLKMYNNPLQSAMASETVWPTPCHLYP